MHSLLTRGAWAGLAIVLFSEVFVIAPRSEAVLLIASAGWMALAGVMFLRAVLRASDPSGFGAWLFGPALGFGFSVFALFVLWILELKGWIAILAAPGFTCSLAWLAHRFGAPSIKLPAFDRRDLLAVVLVLALVPLVTWKPYDHVGEPVEGGQAYRAYFTADFIWAMTVTAELSKGDMPPHNPFLKDEPLHYYWMAHFLSGVLYRNVLGRGVTVEQVVLLDGLMFGLAFVAFAYGLARAVGGGPWASALAVAVGFVANSYEGLDMIRGLVQQGAPMQDLTTVNIDAVSRWFYKGMAVDGLQRLLLYQPHHLPGYALALAALWFAALAEDVTAVSVALWCGLLLGLALLFSTFGALIVGPAVGLVFAVRLLQRRAFRDLFGCAVLGAAPVVIGVVLSTKLGYADQRDGMLLILGPNPVAFHNAGRVILLSFGPLLAAGLASLVRPRWLAREGLAPASLVLAAFAFYFFTNVPDSGDVWVGWRSGHLLLIAFAAMGASTLTAVWPARRFRPFVAAAVVVLVAAALPTVAIDVYNAQDVWNRAEGPGFPWTLVISPAEREGLDWIRASTPRDAVVQVDPTVRGPATWAYIPAFAERRAAAGLPGSMVPYKPYQKAADEVYWAIFHANSADEAYLGATLIGIDYIAIGSPERRAYRESVRALNTRPDLFREVFRNGEMQILRVERGSSKPAVRSP